VWYTPEELAQVATRRVAAQGGEGWSEGAMPVRPPVVTVSESDVAAARAKRLASEAGRKNGSAFVSAHVVPSTTELELAMAAAAREAREAARRSVKRAEFARKVLLAQLKKNVVAV